MLQETEWRCQVFQVLNDKLILINVITYVFVPLLPEGAKPLNVRVRKVAPEPQFSVCVDTEAALVELGPTPDFFSLQAVVTQLVVI